MGTGTLILNRFSATNFILFPSKIQLVIFVKDLPYDTNQTYLKKCFLNVFFKYISSKVPHISLKRYF